MSIYQFDKLSTFLDSLGFPKIGVEGGFKLIKGIDFKEAYEAGSISFENNGIYLEYNGSKYRGYMFISHAYVTYNNQPAKFPRFHLLKCEVIQKFIDSGKFNSRYGWSNADKNDIIDKQSGILYKDEILGLCSKCKQSLLENDNLFEKGSGENITDTDEFHRLLDKSEIAQEGIQVGILGYVKGKERISKQYRNKMKYTCEKCGIKPKTRMHNRFWHTHHINGDKTINTEDNLQCLCIKCHANVDQRHKENFSTGSMKIELENFIKIYF